MERESILLFIWLFILSGFFSWSETALMSLPAHKLQALVKQKKRWSKALAYIKSHNERLLITLLVWNNLVNVITASYATVLSAQIAATSWYEQNLVIGVATWIITLLLLLFGEIIPKTFATRYWEQISLYTAKLFQILWYVLFPLVIVIERIIKILQNKPDQKAVTEEDVSAFLSMSYDSGVFSDDEYQTIKKSLWFYQMDAEDIMTPRTKIEAFDGNLTLQQATDKILLFSHSRIPVYESTIDNVKYVVTLRDLMQFSKTHDKEEKLQNLPLKEIIKIPNTQPIHKLLQNLQSSRTQVAIVIDEYGGTAWLISVEDIVEEVFWEIHDETDKEKESIKSVWNDILVQADVRLWEVLDELDIDHTDVIDPKEDFFIHDMMWETMWYVVTSVLERLPEAWETVRLFYESEHTSTTKEKDKTDEEKTYLVFSVQNVADSSIQEIHVHNHVPTIW